jgi:hypothetical protein
MRNSFIEDDFKEHSNLIGGLYVTIFQKLAFSYFNGFTYGDVDIQVFEVQG